MFLAPKNVEIKANSTSSMLVTITPPEETSGITFYRATSGDSGCQALATMTSLACLISNLPAGSKFEVEAVACASNDVCSSSVSAQGFTLPDGRLEYSSSYINKHILNMLFTYFSSRCKFHGDLCNSNLLEHGRGSSQW